MILSNLPLSYFPKKCGLPVDVCFVLRGKTRQPILLDKFICGFIIQVSGACWPRGDFFCSKENIHFSYGFEERKKECVVPKDII